MNTKEIFSWIEEDVYRVSNCYGPGRVEVAMTKKLLQRLMAATSNFILTPDPTIFGVPIKIMLGDGERFLVGILRSVPPGKEEADNAEADP